MSKIRALCVAKKGVAKHSNVVAWFRRSSAVRARSVGSCSSPTLKLRALVRPRTAPPKAGPLRVGACDHQPIRQRIASTPSAAKNSHKHVAKIARRTATERRANGCAEHGRLTIVE